MNVNMYRMWPYIQAKLEVVPKFISGAEVRLYQNDFDPDNASALADFTQATYTGYAAAPIVFSAAPTLYVDDKGQLIAQWPHVVFQPTGVTVGNIIFGAYIVGAGGTANPVDVLWAERFAASVVLDSPERVIIYEPKLVVGPPLP